MLDARDKKILAHLELDARIPIAHLARSIRLSKQATHYRIERLQQRGIIQQFHAIVDVAKLGKTIHVIYCKLQHMRIKDEKAWIEEIDRHDDVMAVGRNAGFWDLTIVVLAADAQQLDATLGDLFRDRRQHIREHVITTEIEATYLSIFGETRRSTTSGSAEIDTYDSWILQQLSKDCRRRLVDLADESGLSAGTIKNRIRNMEKSGVIIGYKTKLDYARLGLLHFRVFLHMRADAIEKCRTYLADLGNIESISRCIGYADLDFRCHVKDVLELYSMIDGLRDAFADQITSVDSMLIFGWERMRYFHTSPASRSRGTPPPHGSKGHA